MQFLAGGMFQVERSLTLHSEADLALRAAPAPAPPLPPTPAPEPPSPPPAAMPPSPTDATPQTVSYAASAPNVAVDSVSRPPSSPTELGLDAANRGNSMGDGPTRQPTAFPRFGTRDVSTPTVVVARPGQFLSFATPTPVPVLGGTPRRYRSPSRPSPSHPAQGKRLVRPMSSRPSCPRAVVVRHGSLQPIQRGRSERSSRARHRRLRVSSSSRSKGDARARCRSRPIARQSHLPTRLTSSKRHAGRRRARHPQPRKRLETPRCSTYS